MKVSKSAASLLSTWAQARPLMGLMGEFSAGKSTLVNLLLDGSVLPTQVTATQLPVVWLTYGTRETLQGLRPDGTLEPLTFEDLGDTVRDDFLLLKYEVDAEILKRTDIIDAPGISDPRLAKGALDYLGDYLDFVLWCSSATQAWRQSEKKLWTSMPERLRAHSCLIMTRIDKLRHKTDVTKVMKRMARETSDLFRDVVPLNTIGAIAAKQDPESFEWQFTGGEALFAALDMSLENVAKASESAEPSEKMEETKDVEVAEAAAPKKTPAPKNKPISQKVDSNWSFSEIIENSFSKTPRNLSKADILTLFDQVKGEFLEDTGIDPTRRFVLKQCLSDGGENGAKADRLMRQVRAELTDFKSDNWCTLFPASETPA